MSRLSTLQARLTKLEAAYDRALEGQDVTIGDKRLTTARLQVLADEIRRVENEIAVLQGTGGSSRNIGIVKR